MQESLHRLRRREFFFRVPPSTPASSAGVNMQITIGRNLPSEFSKNKRRARKQTAMQQPATASAAGRRFPLRMLRSQKASEKDRRKANAASHRRDLLLIDRTAEHKPRPQRRQSQKRSAGNGKALQNCTQEASVPEFCFHVFSPPLQKGMFVRTEKEPAEVNSSAGSYAVR